MDFMTRPTPYSGLGGDVSEIPEFVTLEDLPEGGSSLVHLGIGVKGAITVDLDSESPHILVNAPTNKGKSTVARSIAVQRLAQGDLVVVLDRKMHSHKWARKLEPLVHYADTTEQIGAGLINLGRELHRRNQIVKHWEGEGPAPVGPRIVVIFEETNATLTQLKALDKRNTEGTYGSLDGFTDLMFMGRAVGMHVIAFAQLASYRSGLTADILENFGTKVLIDYSPQAWKWLASDCGRYRTAPNGDGRGMVCYGSKARETQLAYLPEDEAVDVVVNAIPAQRRARDLVGGNRRNLPEVWRQSLSR